MLRVSLFLIVGVAASTFAYKAIAPERLEVVAATEPTGAIFGDLRPALAAADPQIATDNIITGTVRDVTPSGVTAGPAVSVPLVRVDPPPQPMRPEPPQEARRERLFRVIVVSAGTLKLPDREIRLAGIAVPDFETRCGEGAAAWPCGRMARAALQRFIRARAVECEVPAGAEDVPDATRCSVAGADIAEWLVERGWAKPDGDAYRAIGDTAEEAGLGLWSPTRPGI